jgi:hypothetical protein
VDADKVKKEVVKKWPAIELPKQYSNIKNKHLFIQHDSLNKSIFTISDRIGQLVGKLSFGDAVKVIQHIGFNGVLVHSLDEIKEIDLTLRQLAKNKSTPKV